MGNRSPLTPAMRNSAAAKTNPSADPPHTTSRHRHGARDPNNHHSHSKTTPDRSSERVVRFRVWYGQALCARTMATATLVAPTTKPAGHHRIGDLLRGSLN
jgi:hypothetical protein